MIDRIKYRILLFDDDPVFLDSLEDAIYKSTQSSEYEILILKTTSSRYALDSAESNLFDVFILDICNRQNSKNPVDFYDYQGQDLYVNLLDKHPILQYNSKFIVLSNLKPDTARRIFGYQKADYLYKQDHNCKSIAQYLKCYFDLHYSQNYSNLTNRNNTLSESNSVHIGNISAEQVQIIVNSGRSIVEASQSNTAQSQQLEELIHTIKENIPKNISSSDLEVLNQSISDIRLAITQPTSHKTHLKNICNHLKNIKGIAEFGAAITTLIEFVYSLIS